MRFRFPLLAALFTACSCIGFAQSGDNSAHPVTAVAETVPHRFVVKVRAGSEDPVAAARHALAPLTERFGIASIGSWLDPQLLHEDRASLLHKPAISPRFENLSRILVVEYTAELRPEEVVRKLERLSDFEYVEPIYKRTLSFIPNDPQLGQQSYLQQINAIEAWDAARADSSIIIAIVDTGIDLLHPDLQRAIWRNPRENGTDGSGRDRRTNGIDDDGNGYVDDWIGYDFGGRTGYSPDNDPMAAHWHGTHVAGLAAASGNNGTGIAGVGFGAKLMAVKIADDQVVGDPVLTGGYNGILYAARMGAKIINCSWGGPGRSKAEQELVDMVTGLGCLIVAAVGNDGGNIVSYPASYPNVLSVASVMETDKRSRFSNFNTSVDISAPGELIYSTMPTAIQPLGYESKNGTSMSAPLVSGTAALVASKYRSLTPEQIAAVLRANSDNIDSLNPDLALLLGNGRLNVHRTVTVGPNALFANVIDHQVLDANADRLVEPGEKIELRVRVKNILRQASDLRLEVSAPSGVNATIIAPIENFGPMLTGEIRESHAGTLRLTAPTIVPLDYVLPLHLTLMEGDRKIGAARIEVIVNPSYATTSNNNVTATFTGNGRIGFSDFPTNERGDGFRVEGERNLLAEGGLLVGIGPGRLADVVRSGQSSMQSEGLQTLEPYRTRVSDEERAEIGHARFDDDHLINLQKIGLNVTLKTYAYFDPALNNQILALYTIENTSSVPLDNLFCALFLDWDIGVGGEKDQVHFDPENRLGYMNNTENGGLPFTGTMLLSDQPMNFYAIDNSSYPLSGGFFQSEKWDVISGGIKRETSLIGDVSVIAGAGPIALAPGQDTVVAFSLMVAGNAAELKDAATAARDAFARLGGTPGGAIVLPRQMRLVATGPNPFSAQTSIEFWMPDKGEVKIEAFNAIGERIATLVDGTLPKGVHTATFEPQNQENGVFFIRMFAHKKVLLEKVIYVRK